MKCYNCGTELPSKPKKDWKYTIYTVNMLVCQKCCKSTKAYYREGKLSHTIPKAKKRTTTPALK
jgi:hypothetical protein